MKRSEVSFTLAKGTGLEEEDKAHSTLIQLNRSDLKSPQFSTLIVFICPTIAFAISVIAFFFFFWEKEKF